MPSEVEEWNRKAQQSARNLCIIPARGGSKRIPRKNIKDFLGKPIIAYSIDVAIKSRLFNEVIVSTDDEEISEIAKEYGADVPFLRSAKNSDDHATLLDVVDEVLAFYNGKYDNACCILPTAPLLKPEALIKGFELLINGCFDSIRPVVRYSYPIQRAMRLSLDGKVDWNDKKFARARSQDLEPMFHDSGTFYWMKTDLGLKQSNKRGAFEISELATQDIDTIEDWKLAEYKYKLLNFE